MGWAQGLRRAASAPTGGALGAPPPVRPAPKRSSRPGGGGSWLVLPGPNSRDGRSPLLVGELGVLPGPRRGLETAHVSEVSLLHCPSVLENSTTAKQILTRLHGRRPTVYDIYTAARNATIPMHSIRMRIRLYSPHGIQPYRSTAFANTGPRYKTMVTVHRIRYRSTVYDNTVPWYAVLPLSANTAELMI